MLRTGRRCRELLQGAPESAEAAGLADLIEFAGEQNDVVPWLDRMDVFLMSSATEPYAIAALEAMARGVPVVAMPCRGGLSDLVAEGGLLLPDRKTDTAANAVARLLQSREDRDKLRARAEAVLVENTPDRVLERLEGLYRELTDSLAPAIT